jgi:beta-xylosidase
VLALLSLAPSACTADPPSPHSSATTASQAPSRTTPDLPTGRPTPAAGRPATSFVNPVRRANFPDPGILRVGRLYYAYSTNSSAANVPVMTSPDLVTWTARGDALPELPEWATADDTWAPEVIDTKDGFVLYFTAAAVATGTQCIGRAFSTSPLGPFVDRATDALVCQNEKGGSIDPSPFRAPDGSLHLLWKNDGNCCGYDVDLWSQPLAADGLSLDGAPKIVLERAKPWQGDLIEGPEMVFHSGVYWLFYAANNYASARYAEGVARCTSPAGPCRDSAGPILTSTRRAIGPGHGFVVTTPAGQTWLAYHAWVPGHLEGDRPGRQLWLSRLTWTSAGPVVAKPSTARQTAPAESLAGGADG